VGFFEEVKADGEKTIVSDATSRSSKERNETRENTALVERGGFGFFIFFFSVTDLTEGGEPSSGALTSGRVKLKRLERSSVNRRIKKVPRQRWNDSYLPSAARSTGVFLFLFLG